VTIPKKMNMILTCAGCICLYMKRTSKYFISEQIFLNIHAKNYIFAANAFAIKQDVERAFGNNKRPTLFL
jgi:hypothetical protein